MTPLHLSESPPLLVSASCLLSTVSRPLSAALRLLFSTVCLLSPVSCLLLPPTLFAQTVSPATSTSMPGPTAPSTEAIGLFVLIAILLSRWLWDYNRNRREEAAQHEPRATPPLHKEYVAKADHDQFRAETKKELERHAARRAEIYDEQKKHGEKLARIEAETQRQSADLTLIKTEVADAQRRITAVPERTISLLLDAKKLSTKQP